MPADRLAINERRAGAVLVSFAVGFGVATLLAAFAAWRLIVSMRDTGREVADARERIVRAERAAAEAGEQAAARVRGMEALRAEMADHRLYDPVTGLPTHRLFLDRLAHALALAGRREGILGVYLFDPVREGAGSNISVMGERLVTAITQRIRLALRHGDTVALLDDGRFALLLESLHDVLDAAAIAERLQERFLAPVKGDGEAFLILPRIGIALSDGHESPDDLVRQAEIALAAVHRDGEAPYAIYDPGMSKTALARGELDAALRQAVASGAIGLLYQPIVRLDDEQVYAYEAIPNWEPPDRAPIAGGELLALADAAGLALALGLGTIETAARQVAEWQQSRADGAPPIFLDVPARLFRHPGLAGEIARVLHEAGLGPQQLRLEIDQEVALEDVGATMAGLLALQGIGLGVAIDGFGTGYAALAFLQRSRVECFKIEASYVAGLGVDPDRTAIVRAALAFAAGLDVPVIAVGVETAAQRDELRRLGCPFGQGGHFGPPLRPEELRAGSVA